MITIEAFAPLGSTPDLQLILPFEKRQKSRLLTRLVHGDMSSPEVGIFLPTGTILRGGDVLQSKDGRMIEVIAQNEAVMDVVADSPFNLLRAAYHLGNRHVNLQIKEHSLRLLDDYVLENMLMQLGLQICKSHAPFEPEAGAYSKGHSHGDSPAKLHLFGKYGQ